MQEINFNGRVTFDEFIYPQEESGKISVKAEYRGTPEGIKKAERIMRRTMYRLRAAGVTVFGTIVLRGTGEVRNVVFSTEKRNEKS